MSKTNLSNATYVTGIGSDSEWRDVCGQKNLPRIIIFMAFKPI